MSETNDQVIDERFWDTKKRIVAALILLVIVGVGLGILNSVLKTHKTSNESFTGVERLDVRVGNGTIRLVNTNGDAVGVDRKVDYLLRGPSLSQKVKDGTLQVRQNCSGLHIGQCDTTYTISIPKDIETVVVSGGGTVDLSGTQGDITVSTSGGEINADKAFGKLDLRTDTGNVKGTELASLDTSVATKGGTIQLAFDATPTNVNARSSDGKVFVTVPKGNAAYKVDAGSSNGKSTVNVKNDSNSPRTITARSENGEVRVSN